MDRYAFDAFLNVIVSLVSHQGNISLLQLAFGGCKCHNTVEPGYSEGGKSPILFRYEEVSVIYLVCPIQITPVKSGKSFRYRELSVIIHSVIIRFDCNAQKKVGERAEFIRQPSIKAKCVGATQDCGESDIDIVEWWYLVNIR